MRFLFIITFCFLPVLALAKEKITCVTHPIPLMVEDESKGVFIEMVRKFFAKSEAELEIIVLPRNRSLDYFRNKRALILFPGVGPEDLGEHFLKTVTFYNKRDYLFFRKGENLATLKSLHGKVVGTTLGYPYSKEAVSAEGVHYESASSDEINFKKLEMKRIDAFLVEEVTGLQALKNIGAKNIIYDKDKPISSLPVYFAVQDSAEGKKWFQFLNEKLKAFNKQEPLIETVKARVGL